jgi:hypothetical protein
MLSAVRLRDDFSTEVVGNLARRSKDQFKADVLSLAVVRDGMDRGATAKMGGADQQTVRRRVGPSEPTLPERRAGPFHRFCRRNERASVGFAQRDAD